jgi:hypothetical protein
MAANLSARIFRQSNLRRVTATASGQQPKDGKGRFIGIPLIVLAPVVTARLACGLRHTPISTLVGGNAQLISAHSTFLQLG